MNNYKVKAIIKFNDYEGSDVNNSANSFIARAVGDVFNCTAERYNYLKEHNAVELVEILPEEKPKKEEKTVLKTEEQEKPTPSKKKSSKK